MSWCSPTSLPPKPITSSIIWSAFGASNNWVTRLELDISGKFMRIWVTGKHWIAVKEIKKIMLSITATSFTSFSIRWEFYIKSINKDRFRLRRRVMGGEMDVALLIKRNGCMWDTLPVIHARQWHAKAPHIAPIDLASSGRFWNHGSKGGEQVPTTLIVYLYLSMHRYC